MQTGTVRYHGRRILSLTVAGWAASSAGTAACHGQSAWEQGTAGAAAPRHRCVQARADEGRHLFVHASAEQPWGLPGVVRAAAGCALRRGAYCARLGWDRLHAGRYAEDLIEGNLGAAVAGMPLYVHLVGRCSRYAVEGYPARAAWAGGAAVSADPFTFLSVEAQRVCRLSDTGASPLPGTGEGWRLSACAGRRQALLVGSLETVRLGGRCVRLGLLLGCPEGLRFAVGTRLDTGEISGGLQYAGAVLVAVSWRSHPVLGTSTAVGAGVMLP